jgi:tetratricopeptide (TPR) repeat protein
VAHEKLIKKQEQWHKRGEFEKIVQALAEIPENERGGEITSLYARALNNLSRYEEALALLESIREWGKDDKNWNFRVGYSLYYLDGREAESVPYLERAIELGDDYPDTFHLLEMAREFAEGDGRLCGKALAATPGYRRGAQCAPVSPSLFCGRAMRAPTTPFLTQSDDPDCETDSDEEETEEFQFEPKAFATLALNMRLQPKHRHINAEDPLQLWLQSKKLGRVSGGGTLIAADGEPENCDIEIDLAEDSEQTRKALLYAVSEQMHFAKGSALIFRSANEGDSGEVHPVGDMEGVAVYLNGTDLPDEVYENNDVNDVFRELIDALATNGALTTSYWQGPTETALYFYGEGGFDLMKEKIDPVLQNAPLCENCEVVQIA